MASLPYLIPTARYKRAVKVGNKVTFKPEDAIVDNGIITDLFWSIDADGYNRVTSVNTLTEFYLQVRTQDVFTSVSISIESTVDREEVIEGLVDQIYAIPIAANTQTGVGRGSVKYTIEEDEEMSFRTSQYIDVTSQRAADTTYTNTFGKTIQLSIVFRDASVNYSKGVLLYVNDQVAVRIVDVLQGDHPITALVPPGATYRVEPGSNSIVYWRGTSCSD
jgi:hypothetical protein